MTENLSLKINFSDFAKNELAKFYKEPRNRLWLVDLFGFWIIEHKLKGTYLPDFLKALSERVFLPEIQNVNLKEFNVLDVKIRRSTMEIMLSASVLLEKERRFNPEGVTDFRFYSTIRKAIRSDKYNTFRKVAYVISPLETKESYVGSSTKLVHRMRGHYNGLIAKRHHAKGLQEVFDATGSDPSTMSVFVFDLSNEVDIFEKEQELMDFLRVKAIVLNNSVDARSPAKGRIVSDSSKEKMKISSRRVCHSAQTREAMSKARKGKISYSPEIRKQQIEKVKKPIMGAGVLYPSATEAAKIIGINQSSMVRRLSSNSFPDWYYVGGSKDPNRDLNAPLVEKRKLNEFKSRDMMIEGKLYKSTEDVAKVYGVSGNTVKRRCTFDPIQWPQWKDWFYIDGQ